MGTENMQIKDRRNYPFCIVELRVLQDEDLSTYDKMIYITLCSFASARDRECFPAIGTIARRASCSERQVRISLGVLEALGYIAREFVTGGSTVYTLLDLDERAAQRTEKSEGWDTSKKDSPDAQDTPAPHAGGAAQYAGGAAPHAGGAAPHAGGGGTTCRGGRHTVPPNKKYLTRTIELEKDTQPSVEASPGESPPKLGFENPEVQPQNPEAFLPEPSLPEPSFSGSSFPFRESEVTFYDIQEAPVAMRNVAHYLLMATGRQGLFEEEISVLRTLNASHYPSVVLKEIDVALERFERMERDPKTLTFQYIADAMKYRKSTRSMTPGRSHPVVRTHASGDPDDFPDETESLNT
jgi:hypothetical protein